MQKKPNKWKRSVDQIKNAKIKWTQFSTDKHSVIHHFRLLTLDELQEKYSNLSDFFWRDNGNYSHCLGLDLNGLLTRRNF